MATFNGGPYLHALLTGPPGVGKTTLVKRVCAVVGRERKGVEKSGFYTEEVRGEKGGRVGFDVVTLQGERSVLARTSDSGGAPGRGGRGRERRNYPSVGRYQVDLASFELTALPTLQNTPITTPAVSHDTPDSPMTTDYHSRKNNEFLVTSPHSRVSGSGTDSGSVCKYPPSSKAAASNKRLIVIDEIGKMELFSQSFVDCVKRLFESQREDLVVLATIPVAGRKSHWLLEELRQHRHCKLFQVSEKNRDGLVEEVSHFILQRL